MNNISFINDLKELINEIREEEHIAMEAGNTLHLNGLSQARIMIEARLKKYGVDRALTIESQPEFDATLHK